jgi:acetyltransferase
MPVRNPVDYWPAIEKHGPAKTYKHGMEALHNDPEVDGIIVHLFAGFGIWFLDMKEIMSGIMKPHKPILFWLIGPEKGREPTRLTLEEGGWPTFYEIHRTVKVMASLFENSRRIIRRSEISQFDFPAPAPLKKLDRQRDDQKKKILDEHESKKWFKALGLKVVKEFMTKNLDETAKAAKKMGYPIVLKGISEGQIHKTDVGLVKLNLQNTEQFISAYRKMLRLKTKPKSFLIQPMLKGDLELIVGIIRDPQFGPTAMLGLGGVWAEVYKDVVFRLVPLNKEEILKMVSDLKGQALLKGYRGSKPVNMERLADWLIKLGWLIMTFEEIQEIDVNPLLIVEGEPVAVDATIIFR